MLVRDELVNALRERLDLDFLDPAKAATANVSPASITNGVTNLNDTGATLANTITDIQQFFNAMINNNFDLAQCVWIMPTSVAMQLSLMRDSLGQTAFPTISVNGGTWQGIPVIVSQYLVFGHTPANNKVILVHTPSIAVADDGGFQVDMSREASLEMDDQPVMSSSSIGATPGSPTGPTGSALVSMFQTNSIAIRAERYITWARLRTGAVVWMDDVRWAA
jgi:HK97 family phage major capsid protein